MGTINKNVRRVWLANASPVRVGGQLRSEEADEEDIGLDLTEHAEAAYSDEEEFKLTPDEYPKSPKNKSDS